MSLKETVQIWETRYAAALNDGARGVGRFFTYDADLLPPGPDNVKGSAAIQTYWTAVAEHYHNVRLTTVDAAQLGPDYIREIGTYYAEPKVAGGSNSVWFEPRRVGTRDNQRGGQFAVVVAPE
jgi:ketosteroid isomerase-like protein